jgi:hypothetical protein
LKNERTYKILMNGEEVEEREMHEYADCSFCGGEVKSDTVELVYQYKGKLYVLFLNTCSFFIIFYKVVNY